tara:strand:+ start:159 stop:524 length:366 start_codon:yes stop_codon:yes gene_type:complete
MKKIMIIDDEPLILKYLNILLSEKFEVVTFSKAKNAIQYMHEENTVDNIICDYMMDDANGIDVLNYVINKNYFEDYKKKFIFITAFDDNEIYNKLIRTGCRIVGKADLSIEKIEDLIERQN